ncbi:MAG: tyrosine--tRNA ligase [Candidatus Thermoplasmatota archaeon]|nr:tyrosine--tRNA ligase [Candidatus Thermoplasmatota archaeon]MCL5730762.1 tyrosine--tRNA ligase [Candidatus Thermoplasmatota archaeon]
MDPLETVLNNTKEVIKKDELSVLLESGGTAYIGFEPSGIPTIATGLLWPNKLAEISRSGLKLTVLLADWHAMINDKLGGDLERIRASGELMKRIFLAAGLPHGTEFLWTSDNVSSSDYWKTLLKVAKAGSLARIRRALPIMGRTEEEADRDFSKYIYPLMQVTDIIYNSFDLALGGMDQRHAHMLCRDIQDKLKMKKVVAIHTGLITSLNSGGRMDFSDPAAVKMSKSDPNSGIFIFDEPETIERKISKAYCPQGTVDGNPLIDIARMILIPYGGGLNAVATDGETLRIRNSSDLEENYRTGRIHPSDLKRSVAESLSEMLKPFSRIKEESGDLISLIQRG